MQVRYDWSALFPGLGKFLKDGAPGGIQNFMNGQSPPAPAASAAPTAPAKPPEDNTGSAGATLIAPIRDEAQTKTRKTLLGGYG